jgi:hypothetical protein
MDGFGISRCNGTWQSKPQAGNVLLRRLIQQRSGAPKVIFNMDETTMFYNSKRTMASEAEKFQKQDDNSVGRNIHGNENHNPLIAA